MKELISGIYKITSPTNKIYIGQAENLLERKYDYENVLAVKSQIRIYRSLIKYGFENHTWEVQEYCSIEQLDAKERYWQDFYDVIGPNGLNCVLKEVGEKRRRVCEETRKRLSEAQMGKKLTEEHKKNISLGGKGRITSEETKKKRRETRLLNNKPNKNKGVKLTKEHSEKIGKALKGKKKSENHVKNIRLSHSGKPVLQFDMNDVFIKEWESAYEAARGLDIFATSIYSCCIGKKDFKSAYGFKWKYKLKEEI